MRQTKFFTISTNGHFEYSTTSVKTFSSRKSRLNDKQVTSELADDPRMPIESCLKYKIEFPELQVIHFSIIIDPLGLCYCELKKSEWNLIHLKKERWRELDENRKVHQRKLLSFKKFTQRMNMALILFGPAPAHTIYILWFSYIKVAQIARLSVKTISKRFTHKIVTILYNSLRILTISIKKT